MPKTTAKIEGPRKRKLPNGSSVGALPAKKHKGTHDAIGNKGKLSEKVKKSKLQKPSQPVRDAPKTAKERRLQAKELAESRKKKRKKHYTLEQELSRLWEKMRQRNITKVERSELISQSLQKLKGKIPEIASSHVSSRILQTCLKYCSPSEKEAVFSELKPHFLNLACNTYAVHLIKKMLDAATKQQLSEFVSLLRGHVASLLRHMVGSVVIEHVYQLGNASQKQMILLELYSTEFQLFKDLSTISESRVIDVISKLGLQKSAVSYHMNSVLQPILEKGIVDHSIIHKLIIEYLSIADKTSSMDIIKQLSSPLLVRMIHTKDGSRIGILCCKYGSAKERKKLIKGMKEHVSKVARDHYGSLVLSCIEANVDDTQLVSKIIIRELKSNLKDLVMDKFARRPIVQLLHPNCTRYFSPDDITSLNSSIPSLTNQDENMEILDSSEGGKKDPLLRRQELLLESGLAEKLVEMCIENAGEMLKSNIGKEVIYEVASGGFDGILVRKLGDKLKNLYEEIASIASNSDDELEDHILVNFHSSRMIRKLILDCSEFASIFWDKALKGKCSSLANGHSSKVISAYLATSDPLVRKLSSKELKPLVDGGVLKASES